MPKERPSHVQSCLQCNESIPAVEGAPLSFCPHCRFPLMWVAGEYRLCKVLGEGGFGVVYLAQRANWPEDAHFVLKVLRSELLSREEVVHRFRREVKVTAALAQQCPHIVRIYGDFREEPKLGYYYVMEYLQGESLSQVLKRPSLLSDAQVVSIFFQLCKAMFAAHEADIIHRDLKPDNLFLLPQPNDEYFVKILDFGVAKVISETQTASIQTQGAVGTPLYMPPEQFLGQATDRRSDIFAMGGILYELLTGAHPHGNWAVDKVELFAARLSEPPPSLTSSPHPREHAQALDPVLRQALSPQPEHRFASVSDFWEAFAHATQLDLSSFSLSAPAALPHTAVSLPSVDGLVAVGPSDTQVHAPFAALAQEHAEIFGETVERETPLPQAFTEAAAAAPTAHSPNSPVIPPNPKHLWSFLLGGLGILALILLWRWGGGQPSAPSLLPLRPSLPKTSLRNMPDARANATPSLRATAPHSVPPRDAPCAWNIYRQGFDRTGFCDIVGPRKRPSRVRSFRLNGWIESSPLFSDGYAIIATKGKGNESRGEIYMVDIRREKVLGQVEFPGWILATPLVVGGVLYVTFGREVVAMSLHSRDILWRFPLRRYSLSSPLWWNNFLFLGDSSAHFYAIDAISGKGNELFRAAGRVEAAPTLSKDLMFIGAVDTTLRALNHRGEQRWFLYTRRGAFLRSAAVAGDLVFFGDSVGYLYALRQRDGKTVWTFFAKSAVTTAPAVDTKQLYFGTEDGTLFALDWRTGALRWKQKLGGALYAAPFVTRNTVYLGCLDFSIYALDKMTGRILWSWKTPSRVYSSPLVVGKTLIVTTWQGILYLMRE